MTLIRRVALALIPVTGLFAGCGPKYHEVKGVVKLDGAPVAAANVNFVSEDGTKSFGGFTNASGEYTITDSNTKGVPTGAYKVTVTKTKEPEGFAPGGVSAADPSYMKQMQKENAEMKGAAAKSPGGPGKMMMPPGAGKMMMPPAGPGGPGVAVSAPKYELPAKYASAGSTPLLVQVPAPDGIINIDLQK